MKLEEIGIPSVVCWQVADQQRELFLKQHGTKILRAHHVGRYDGVPPPILTRKSMDQGLQTLQALSPLDFALLLLTE